MRTNYKIFDDMRMDSIMSQPSKKKKKQKETKKETQLRPFESKMLRVNRMIQELQNRKSVLSKDSVKTSPSPRPLMSPISPKILVESKGTDIKSPSKESGSSMINFLRLRTSCPFCQSMNKVPN